MRLTRAAGFAVFFLTASIWGQSDRGIVTGTVTDATGAVIPGAKITVTNAATNAANTFTTTEAGSYVVPGLQVGQYSVRVEKEGFKPAVRTEVTLNAATTVRIDFTIEVGAASQAIEVQAQALAVNAENAKTSVTVTQKLVDELPLVVGGNLRSPFDLAQLTPEAKNFGDNNFSLGGGQASGYGVTLDGVSAATTRALQTSWIAVNAPSLEAITEFTVDTNGFKAEFGHAAGGLMTFASKSGTNQYHGSLYEFLRNNAFDARRFYERQVGIYKQHDFGGSIGGPVIIPKIYNGRDKTFFFFSYEAFRNRVGASTRAVSVPTSEMYGGDFSRWVNASGVQIPIYDPATTRTVNGQLVRDQFPDNRIPTSRFDPQATKLLGVYGPLAPNNGAAAGSSDYVRSNYLISSGTELNPRTKWSVKPDHIFSEKNRLSGYIGVNRVSKDAGPQGPNTLPGFHTDFITDIQDSDVYRMTWTHTLSPTILNVFYAGGNNWREGHYSPNELLGNWKDKFCLANVPDCNDNLSSLGFSEYQAWGGPSNNGSENTIFSFNNDLTMVKGRHTIKFGGMYQRSHYNGFGEQWQAGRTDYSFTATGRPGDTNFATAGGNSFASFLLGRPNYGEIHTVRFISQQWPYFAGYVQDDWRVNSKLTLNYGLRWETTLPPVEANDKWSDFDPNRPNPRADNLPGALIYAGTGEGREGSRSLAGSYYKAFGPRFGAAYSLNDKTVIRTAVGLAYGAITTVTGSTHQRGFTQVFGVSSGDQGINPAFQLSQGFPDWPRPPFIDPSFSNRDSMPWWQGSEATRPPANTFWTLSIQRQVGRDWVVETGYNGNAGSRLQAGLLRYNQVDPRYLQTLGPDLLRARADSPQAQAAGIRVPFANFNSLWGSNATVSQALRPFPQYNDIDTASGGGDHSGHSSYHAALLRVEKRGGNGLTVQGSYVYSKILTDADSYWVGGSIDHYNRSLEKSIGQFDVPHNAKLALIYELPIGRGKALNLGGVGNALIGGWRLSSVHYYSSGLPVSVGTSIGLPLHNGGNRITASTYEGWQGAQKADSFDPQDDRFFQPASFFGPQPTNRFGNVTRYNPSLREFPIYNENVSVAKSFGISESARIDFRAEAFNVFNRVRFGTGNRTLQDPNFGKLVGNGDIFNDPRRLQFALKLYF